MVITGIVVFTCSVDRENMTWFIYAYYSSCFRFDIIAHTQLASYIIFMMQKCTTCIEYLLKHINGKKIKKIKKINLNIFRTVYSIETFRKSLGNSGNKNYLRVFTSRSYATS